DFASAPWSFLLTRLISTSAFLLKALFPRSPRLSPLAYFGPGATKRLHLRLPSFSLSVYLFTSQCLSLSITCLAMKNTTLTTRDGWCFLFYLPFLLGLFF
ncbi:hypothetical protein COCMIDRAFT_94394, partial [Bipolaris oryzae ATCC 44560]